MTPNEAARASNHKAVKTKLDSIHKSNNRQAVINVGDNVRVIIKKNVPDWADKLHKVVEKKEWKHVRREDGQPVDPPTMQRPQTQPMIYNARRIAICATDCRVMENHVTQ